MPLFVVSTPIGNLKDITFRAIEVFKSCDLILSEDTRTTSSLLSFYQITGKKILPFTDFTKEEEYEKFADMAKTLSVVLVSEAGTPCISDPGYTITKKALEMGVEVSPVVGACSLAAAISASGLAFGQFAFLGFYEKSLKEKLVLLLKNKLSVAVFLPARDIAKVLSELQNIIKNHEICIARELTKMYEDIKKGSLQSLSDYYKDEKKLKGEAILLISFVKLKEEKEDLKDLLEAILNEKSFLKEDKVPLKYLADVLKTYEENLSKFSKKEIYNTLIEIYNYN